ncbi:synaptic vesicle glycoprotein 2B [Scaptodrosophila lebanonensis]|uniref:Synaptic vesicle glycoprotein 2B n=1 Tax=Drosophila lebanonensis TaxID=7225 RepID=A0A6J2TSP6_DROLE|nr:synaptic vesicle glycoprotein 2B [Scaptodrosophila lebanonensis]
MSEPVKELDGASPLPQQQLSTISEQLEAANGVGQQQQRQEQEDVAKSLPEAADFETAIDAAGFGLFNILLLLVSVPSAMATVFETSTMSYILPSAECDLRLSLLDKGILNAITYAGMISSAIFWGYVADTKGRKKLLIFGFVADTVCVLGGAISQNVVQLMVFKYLGGFVISGPFAVLMSYLTELHGRQHRQRVMMVVGIMFSIATLCLPGLAMLILPEQWNIHIWGLSLHSWQVFLAISALPSILSSILLNFFPESPKFLMSQGRNKEAMQAFQLIYALNHHKARSAYPIKLLVNEVPEKRSSLKADVEHQLGKSKLNQNGLEVSGRVADKPQSSLRAGLAQLRPLFVKPYLGLSLSVYLLNFCVLLGQNTMRLWLPQLFASITEYEQLMVGQATVSDSSICRILEFSVNRTQQALLTGVQSDGVVRECTVNISAASYSNNLIVSFVGLFSYMVAGSLVNLVGVKRILSFGLFIAGCCGIGMYWSSSAASTVAIASLFVALGSISSTSVISASVSLFPTSLRTMIVSLEMMFGRLGSLLGNIFFPTLMNLGCIPPFLMIGLFMLSASVMAAFLPLKNKAALK